MSSLICMQIVFGQDIEETFEELNKRIEENPIEITGGIQSNLSLSAINGSEQRVAPFTYQLMAHVQADVLGVRIPGQFIHSSTNTVFDYKLPALTFAGISPSYKWATLHLGDRTMQFSPYTLSGHHFRGVGAELRPGRFRIKAMYGRLRRAREEDIGTVQDVEPLYRRLGWGVQAGYVTKKDAVYLTLFKAWDDAGSTPEPEKSTLRPAENVIISAKGNRQIGKVFQLGLEIARSALTTDTNTPEYETVGLGKTMAGLITPRVATGYYWAVKTDLEAKTNIGSFILGHEWIDPGYSTLGAIFFNNDVERFTVSSNQRLLENKLQVSTRLGLERNNLSGFEANRYNRFVGSVNLSYVISELTSMVGSYSNFSNTNRLRSLNDPLNPIDTIRLALVNQQVNLSVTHRFREKGGSILSAILSWQKANNIMNDIVQSGQNNTFLVTHISYILQKQSSPWALTSALLTQTSSAGDKQFFTWGPSLGIRANLMDKKLSMGSSGTFSIAYLGMERSGNIFNWNTYASFQLGNNHRMGLNAYLISRNSKVANRTSFTEIRSVINYGWNF